ncbi:SDR family oxidoreductase [Phyllobacterium sp. 628]|uniref:SDR family NAD(P)-dependent oxidoreductase n=1 Tax=Phyllobacterium sp. 628 TaxID=2718938 RepID=UPI001662390B|nr:SDR family oxidoreductase [Phyllobacterium sp. 628]QND52177.1 SDR family oxidoreductase [Phyllobacterium sp. 628]
MTNTTEKTSTHKAGGKEGTALVTGASAGLGKIYADRLAGRGYDLILVARREDRLEALAEELRGRYGVNIATIMADLANSGDLDKVAKTLSTSETITMLVNNAGTSTLGSLGDTPLANVDSMTDVNITALVRLSLAALPAFKRRGRGTIINLGSILSFHTLPHSSAYSGTKGYVMNFTRGLQQEVAETNVRVQLVLPAATATDIWELSGVPLDRLDPTTVMDPEACVDAALAGLDQGELITLPSLEDIELFNEYDAARLKLLSATQRSAPATRYTVGK